MKASSLFVAGLAVAIISIAPANAYNPQPGCSTTTGVTSGVPCTPQTGWKPVSYVECTAHLREQGWRDNVGWWWCGNQHLKN